MNSQMLELDCAEWREVAAESPAEMEVVVEMMIAAEEDVCYDEAA